MDLDDGDPKLMTEIAARYLESGHLRLQDPVDL